MDIRQHLGRRVVLTCENNLSFAGRFLDILQTPRAGDAAMVELDASSGFAILCPVRFIQSVMVVPLDDEPASDETSADEANPNRECHCGHGSPNV